jgi:hypothetical protein
MAATQVGNTHGVTAAQGTSTQAQVQTFESTAASGTFKVRLGTKFPTISYVETGAIARNAAAATLQTALRALKPDGINAIGTGIVCAGGALATNPVTATWAGKYAGLAMPVFEIINIDLAGGTVTCTETTPASMGSFVDTDLDSIAAMRARLTAIDGTTFSSANLDKMTSNDMMYAIRLLDESWTI